MTSQSDNLDSTLDGTARLDNERSESKSESESKRNQSIGDKDDDEDVENAVYENGIGGHEDDEGDVGKVR